MWSAIKGLFTSSTLVENVSKGVDSLIFTDQEKGEAWERLLTIYHPFKIAQRIIAVTLLALIGISFLLAVAIRVIGLIAYPEPTPEMFMLIQAGKYTPEYIQLSDWILTHAYKLFFEPFLWAVIFYFGGGATEGLVNSWKGRNKGYLSGLGKTANVKVDENSK